MKLEAVTNRQVVEGVIRAVNKYCVSAEVAGRVDEGLRRRLRNGDYDRVTSAFDLIDALDKHMQEVSKDRHLALAYSHVPEPLVEGFSSILQHRSDDAQTVTDHKTLERTRTPEHV